MLKLKPNKNYIRHIKIKIKKRKKMTETDNKLLNVNKIYK